MLSCHGARSKNSQTHIDCTTVTLSRRSKPPAQVGKTTLKSSWSATSTCLTASYSVATVSPCLRSTRSTFCTRQLSCSSSWRLALSRGEHLESLAGRRTTILQYRRARISQWMRWAAACSNATCLSIFSAKLVRLSDRVRSNKVRGKVVRVFAKEDDHVATETLQQELCDRHRQSPDLPDSQPPTRDDARKIIMGRKLGSKKTSLNARWVQVEWDGDSTLPTIVLLDPAFYNLKNQLNYAWRVFAKPSEVPAT